ncbi:T9SS type A sorting domain-containing protein [Vicingus serpentipes]|uniref:T9SS type A sorting domain-containing protein n=1 Tax=Vicingus serpentipes TaxID=1926625 RepID=A0A5C6RPW4_9FLAO|nr:aryl-sulfate sulfotransferase [Vicingus serpentipes]TXB63690.1 T9SS type A sorting domain-containing protein [Vicingus serpentipes]
MKIKKIFFVLTFLVGSVLSLKSQNTVGTIFNSLDAQDGYTLFAYTGDTITYLIDNCGQVVNQWNSEYGAGNSVYLLDDGGLIRCGKTPVTFFNAGGRGGLLEIFDWQGNLNWQFFYSDTLQSLHHDVALLPNGNILAIAFELKTKQESIDAGRDTSLLAENALWPEKIIEIKPIGFDSAEIVWEWHMWDHLIQDYDNTKPNFGVVEEHPELFNLNYAPKNKADWAHANAIDYNADLDQIILSLNFFNEFIIIDHSTSTLEAASSSGGLMGKGGDILYRYGNPESYNHGDSLDRINYSNHNVQWIADSLVDGGKIMIYNNGNGRPAGNYSSIDIIDPLTDAFGNYILEADTTFGPDFPEWSYVAPNPTDFYSPNISGAQRLPNGNTLICQGRDARLFEIDTNEDIVWEYWSPVTNGGILSQGDIPIGNRNVFRALRYEPSYLAFSGKDLTPGLPIELNPDLTDCLTTGVKDFKEFDSFNLSPNPVNDVLRIEINQLDVDFVRIYDISGQLVYESSFVAQIDISNLKSGLYFVSIGQNTRKIIKR